MRRCYHLLWLLVRECVTSVEDFNPAGSDVDTSLSDSSDDFSFLNPNDGSKLPFSISNEAVSDLAADDMFVLNLDGGDKLLFGDPNDTDSDLTAEDSLFNLNSQDTLDSNIIASDDSGSSDDPNSLIIADANKPNNCNSNDNNQQLLSRNRARSNNDDFCVEVKTKLPPAPREGYYTPLPNLITDEELKRFFCPTELFQGILNIPVCALYDNFGLFVSDIFSLELMSPISNTRLTNVRPGKLSRWIFFFVLFLFCFFATLIYPPTFPFCSTQEGPKEHP